MSIRIVIVDNAPELIGKLTGYLASMEDVTLCAAFEEAVAVVDYVKTHEIDMVFTDIVMPDISGISLASELHKLPTPPAVVMMSSIPGFSLEAWKIRAFGFVEKPYTRHDILNMIQKYRNRTDE